MAAGLPVKSTHDGALDSGGLPVSLLFDLETRRPRNGTPLRGPSVVVAVPVEPEDASRIAHDSFHPTSLLLFQLEVRSGRITQPQQYVALAVDPASLARWMVAMGVGVVVAVEPCPEMQEVYLRHEIRTWHEGRPLHVDIALQGLLGRLRSELQDSPLPRTEQGVPR